MHSAALTQMGRLYLWWDNEDGQLGSDDTLPHLYPLDITDNFNLVGEEKIVKVELGNYFSSVLTSSGRLFAWGYNSSGELGDGENLSRQMPYDITANFGLIGEETIVDMSLGGSHTLALNSNNRLFSWGYNNNMQLGDGTTTSRNIPGDITSHFTFASGETIIQIATGNHHSAVVTSFGEVYTFGFNFYGQLGDGSTLNKGIPTNITGQFSLGLDEKVERVTLGVHFSSAITNKSHIYTWGLNTSSQLGDGTIVNSSNPINISSLFSFDTVNSIIDVAICDRFMAIVDTEGLMYI
jgi:alpha-tubulin suppressor-like RCC1 family protein